jgi:hypothetical protein
MEVQSYLSGFGQAGIYVDLSTSIIYGFKRLILGAINKLLSGACYPDAEKILQKSSDYHRITAFIPFARTFWCYKTSPCIRGPCALSYDYYMQGGGWFRNSYFLFGIASQFRIV